MSAVLTLFGYHVKDIIHNYKDFHNNFILGEHICDGAQGSIYETSPRNTHRNKNIFYLITKLIAINNEYAQENILKSVQEYLLMRTLNMIHFNGISYTKNKNKLLLTMEMLEYNLSDAIEFNLDNRIHDFKCISTDYGLKYFILEVTSFLHQLHSIGFVHLDIKPDNIMFRNGKNEYNLFYGNGWKVIDLGLTEYIGHKNKNKNIKLNYFIGTKGYAAPEMHTDKLINYKSDIWALGVVILYILNNGYNIFNNKYNPNNNFINSHLMNLYLTNKINFKLYDLLSQMLEINPNKRPNTKDIFKHSYFNNIVFEGQDNEFYCYRNKFRFISKKQEQINKSFVSLTQNIKLRNTENN
eukprot:441773_1